MIWVATMLLLIRSDIEAYVWMVRNINELVPVDHIAKLSSTSLEREWLMLLQVFYDVGIPTPIAYYDDLNGYYAIVMSATGQNLEHVRDLLRGDIVGVADIAARVVSSPPSLRPRFHLNLYSCSD